MKRGIFLVGVFIVLIGVFAFIPSKKQTRIDSFQECEKQGNSVAESFPRTCRTKDGQVFTENITTPAPTTSPSPYSVEPTASPDANIVVSDPKPDQKISTAYIVSGKARVFENVIQYRLKDADNNILAEGNTSSQSPDVGQFGPFVITLRFEKPKTKSGVLEVFSSSPKDGSEINKVSINLKF